MKKFALSPYILVVPFLELNDTHVFNPDSTPHVGIYEIFGWK
ncbi:MAG: hypothetical protein AAGB24_15390 [Bacteroidota bacterium]